ncbi:MAG: hypothetical protein DMG17_05810 [Acidobacteria bacterium]|nr:MAG: hypothetical protein DMG17_05810 [Acidobacteriota bacterium]
MGSSDFNAEVKAFDSDHIVRGATSFAWSSVVWRERQTSTCCRRGSKFRWMRSTPTASESTIEKFFECFASTGVKSP